MHIFSKLYQNNLMKDCPPWIENNLCYLTMHGSHAYKVNKDDSDNDIYGIVIPPKSEVFFTNEIIGFGRMKHSNNRFQHYQKHQLANPDNNKIYDFTIANIVDFCELASQCNPNWLEMLFVDIPLVMHQTEVGKLLRDNRKVFISKKVYHTMTNYAFSQISKAKNSEKTGKRQEEMQRLGYSTKSLYHCARLIDQCEQLLLTGEMELGRNKEYLKAIRREEINYDEVLQRFKEKEVYLRNLYETSNVIPYDIQTEKVKQILINCLEHHYGSLKEFSNKQSKYLNILREFDSKLRSISNELYQ